jgi:chromosome segregation ATPase
LLSTLNHENELTLVLERWKVHKEEIVNYEIKMDTLRANERELQKQVWKHEEASKNDLLSLLSSRLKEKKEMQSIIDAKAKRYCGEEAHLIGVMTDLENSRNHSILPEVQEWRRAVEILDVQIKNCELEMQRIQSTMNDLSHKMKREQSLSVELAGKKSALADLEIRHSKLKAELEQKQLQRNEMCGLFF